MRLPRLLAGAGRRRVRSVQSREERGRLRRSRRWLLLLFLTAATEGAYAGRGLQTRSARESERAAALPPSSPLFLGAAAEVPQTALGWRRLLLKPGRARREAPSNKSACCCCCCSVEEGVGGRARAFPQSTWGRWASDALWGSSWRSFDLPAAPTWMAASRVLALQPLVRVTFAH